jgi:hypothetical protein
LADERDEGITPRRAARKKNYRSRLIAKAFPDPLLRYFSNRIACIFVGKAQYQTSS